MKLFAGQFATKLMLFATYALALTAAVSVVLEIVLVWNVDDHGMMVELTELEQRGDEPPLEPAMLESLPQLELNVSEPALSQQEAENVFLELAPPRGFTQRWPPSGCRPTHPLQLTGASRRLRASSVSLPTACGPRCPGGLPVRPEGQRPRASGLGAMLSRSLTHATPPPPTVRVQLKIDSSVYLCR